MVTRRKRIEDLRIRSILYHDRFTRYLAGFTFLFYTPLFLLNAYCVNIGLTQITTFIPSLAELVSVFVGLAIAYTIERARNKKNTQQRFLKLLTEIVNELTSNQILLPYIYASAGVNYLSYLLKTNIYEIYEDSVDRLGTDDLENLTKIYHNQYIINESIRQYNYSGSYSSTQDRDKIIEMKRDTQKLIKEWITTINKRYAEDLKNRQV